MDSLLFSFYWVQRCINSCTNEAQLDNAEKLVGLFYDRYGHMTFYKHLQGVYSNKRDVFNNIAIT